MIDDIGNGRTAGDDRRPGEEARARHRARRTRHRRPIERIPRRGVRVGRRSRHARDEPLLRRKEAQDPTDGALSDHGRVPAARGGAGGGRGRGRQSLHRGRYPAAGAHRVPEVGGHDPSVGAGRPGRWGAEVDNSKTGAARRSVSPPALAILDGDPSHRTRVRIPEQPPRRVDRERPEALGRSVPPSAD